MYALRMSLVNKEATYLRNL